jgi:cyclomaltodextrinase / maltogenic alpha-amylase / neopullulanase
MGSWIDETAWWHIYPLGFLGAEKEALSGDAQSIPRLRNLEPWLKYLLELGCNGLLLAPIFSSATHGYDTTDFFKIDPRIGNEEDFQWLVDTCKSFGIKLVLDGVFNHVGRQFGPFQDVKYHRQGSRYAHWFHIDWNNGYNEDGFSYKNFEGHHQLVTLNHDNPEIIDYVSQVMTHWLSKGINGWRLDAAYAVPQHFWKQTLPRVTSQFPDAWILGEVIHGDYANIASQTSLHSITQYELWKAIWSGLNDRNFFELSHALNRHNQFLSTLLPNIFLGNHDVTRIATQLKEPKHLDLALCILTTVPGIPSIYAGDEQAFRGRKEHRPGGDDEIRPAFPGDPSGFAPEGWNMFTKYQTMIRFRRKNSWIAHGRIKVLTLSNMFLVYEVSADNTKVVVALNCGDTPVAITDQTILSNRLVYGASLNGAQIDAHSAAVWTNS